MIRKAADQLRLRVRQTAKEAGCSQKSGISMQSDVGEKKVNEKRIISEDYLESSFQMKVNFNFISRWRSQNLEWDTA